MIKVFCDRCGVEINIDGDRYTCVLGKVREMETMEKRERWEVCKECQEEIKAVCNGESVTPEKKYCPNCIYCEESQCIKGFALFSLTKSVACSGYKPTRHVVIYSKNYEESCKEWLKGCTNASEGNPEECEECTMAFLNHIKKLGKGK